MVRVYAEKDAGGREKRPLQYACNLARGKNAGSDNPWDRKKLLLIGMDRGKISLHSGKVMRKGGSVRKGNWNLEGKNQAE